MAGPEPGQSGAERAPAGPEPGQCEMADGRRNLLRCVATYAPKFRAGRSGSWSRSRAAWPEWFRVGRVGAGWSCSLDCAEREPETWSQPARAPELAKLQLLSILCMFQALSFKKHTHTHEHIMLFLCMYVCMSVCVCLHVCMYVCMYVCMCVFVCNVCVYVCMCVCMYVYVCMYVCIFVCNVCVYVCVYVCMYVCMFVCMYVCNACM